MGKGELLKKPVGKNNNLQGRLVRKYRALLCVDTSAKHVERVFSIHDEDNEFGGEANGEFSYPGCLVELAHRSGGGEVKEFRVGTFYHGIKGEEHLKKSYSAYTCWYDPYWGGCVEYFVKANNGKEAKVEAIKIRMKREMEAVK